MKTARTHVNRKCPRCGYDLSGSADSERVICPECGREFAPDPLIGASGGRPWTPAIGLRNAAVWLLLRSLLAGLFWCGFLWWLTTRINAAELDSMAPIYFTVGAPLILGFAVGFVVSHRLFDQAGFVHPLVTAMASVCGLSIVWGGVLSVQVAIEPLSAEGYRWLFPTVGSIGAMIWIVRSWMQRE